MFQRGSIHDGNQSRSDSKPSMKVRDVLLLKQESLIEIPKSAGENLDIYINGKLIGCGEILDMEGNAGIRLTDYHEKV